MILLEVVSILLSVALWLAVAYLTARIANDKGYGFWLPFVMGVFTYGGMLLIVLIAKRKREISEEQEKQFIQIPNAAALKRLGARKTCHRCGNSNPVQSIGCSSCGTILAFSNNSKTVVETMFLTEDVREEVNEGHIRVCQRCGRLNSPKRRVCKSCGAEFAV